MYKPLHLGTATSPLGMRIVVGRDGGTIRARVWIV
jgi:hypothetical protein